MLVLARWASCSRAKFTTLDHVWPRTFIHICLMRSGPIVPAHAEMLLLLLTGSDQLLLIFPSIFDDSPSPLSL